MFYIKWPNGSTFPCLKTQCLPFLCLFYDIFQLSIYVSLVGVIITCSWQAERLQQSHLVFPISFIPYF